jgi:hypothetical protein
MINNDVNLSYFDCVNFHELLKEKVKNKIKAQIENGLKEPHSELTLIINNLALTENCVTLETLGYRFSLKYKVIQLEPPEQYGIDFTPFIICQPLYKFRIVNLSRWKLHISLDQANTERFYNSVNIVGNILLKNQIKFKIIRDASINLVEGNNQAGKQVTIYYGEAIDNIESLCRDINKSLTSNGIKPDPHHDGSIPSAQNGVDRFISGSVHISYRCDYINWKNLSENIQDQLRQTVMSVVKNDLSAYSYYMNAMIKSNYLPAYCVNIINSNNFYNPLYLEDPLLNVSVLSDSTNIVQQKPLQIIEKKPETKSSETPKPRCATIYQFKNYIDLSRSFSLSINDADKFKSFFKVKAEEAMLQHKNKKSNETQSLSEESQLSC